MEGFEDVREWQTRKGADSGSSLGAVKRGTRRGVASTGQQSAQSKSGTIIDHWDGVAQCGFLCR